VKANFNSPLELSSNRRKVKVRGPLVWEDDGGRRVRVKDVQVTPGTVVAQGLSGEFKRGEDSLWWCDADSDEATFSPGVATAFGTVERTDPGPVAEVFNWSQAVFLQ
jgi:hypothetical protein